jgi:hypothetical protein
VEFWLFDFLGRQALQLAISDMALPVRWRLKLIVIA